MPVDQVEEAIARMLELFPEGFVEEPGAAEVKLVAFTDESGVVRARESFGAVGVSPVAAGWEDDWRRFHVPVVVGPLWIGPPWESPPAGPTPVVVDPGRAFGTGAHATTRLCVELLVDLERGSLADVGCGSGVLAIAAAKLGFAPVSALDLDAAAVEAALGNAERNGVEIDVELRDVRAGPPIAADVVVANLDFATVDGLASNLDCRLAVTSGYLSGEHPKLPGFLARERRSLGEWAADLWARE